MAGPRQLTRKLYIELVLRAEHNGKKNAASIKKAERTWRSWSKDTQNLFVQLMRASDQQENNARNLYADFQNAQEIYDDHTARGLEERKDSILNLSAAAYVLLAARQQHLRTIEELANFLSAQQCSSAKNTTMTEDIQATRYLVSQSENLVETCQEHHVLEQQTAARGDRSKYRWTRPHRSDEANAKAWRPMQRMFDWYRNPPHGWTGIQQLEPGEESAPKFWQPPLPVYGSSRSWVSLLLATNEDETTETSRILPIVDKLIRKDVDLSSFWSDADTWDRDVRDIQNRIPFELACHLAVNNNETGAIISKFFWPREPHNFISPIGRQNY